MRGVVKSFKYAHGALFLAPVGFYIGLGAFVLLCAAFVFVSASQQSSGDTGLITLISAGSLFFWAGFGLLLLMVIWRRYARKTFSIVTSVLLVLMLINAWVLSPIGYLGDFMKTDEIVEYVLADGMSEEDVHNKYTLYDHLIDQDLPEEKVRPAVQGANLRVAAYTTVPVTLLIILAVAARAVLWDRDG